MNERFEMVAKTFHGLEDVLSDELIALGAENVEPGNRMVTFEGDRAILYKANMCCRTALRILKPIVKFRADNPEELYDYVRDLPWEQFLDIDKTFSIDSTVYGEEFSHSRFVTYRVKDAIADHFFDSCGRRPSVSVSSPDIILNVHISGNRVTISLDSSGEPLYKRGYRVAQTEAPLNEVLAAGIILKTGWRGDCDFADPMCGSGTFLVEAALIAANINPGIYRESFAFEKWKDFDADLFEEIYNDDSEERDFNYKIYGGDIDPEAVKAALRNVKSAKVDEYVQISCKPMSEWEENAPEGVLVTNPPYGERLKPENIKATYKSIGTTLKNYFAGWHAWILGYRDEHFAEIGLKPSLKTDLFNGALECSLREYVMFNGKYSQFKADGGTVANKHAAENNGPRKVKHISEDEWTKTSRKFNRKEGFAAGKSDRPRRDKHSDKKSLRPDYYTDETDNNSDERRFNTENRDTRPFNRENRPFKKEGRDNRDKRPFSSDKKEAFNRDNRGGQGFNRDNRSSGRDNRGRQGFSRDKQENRQKRGELRIVNPRNPSIPVDRQEIINPVYFRRRKQRPDQSAEEE